MSLLDEQIALLKEEFPCVSMLRRPDGSHLVTIPKVALPQGWSQNETTIRFLLSPAYPHAKPDCFWTDETLRLANGAQPQNTNIQVIPNTNERCLWFSWHTSHWNPNRDTLTTYMNVVSERLKKAQ